MEDHYARIRLAARSTVLRVVDLLDQVWRREPTMFIELGVAWTVGVWAVTLIAFGTSGYPPVIALSLGRLPVFALGLSGGLVAGAQIGAIVTRHRISRGYGSFAAAIWLGYLSFSIIAGNHQLAGGYVYLGTAAAALLPFWRVVLDRRI